MKGRLLVAVASGLTIGACIDITVNGADVGSLEFVALPYPSVNAGDTLRDTLGKVWPLQARVYRVDNTVDDKVPITFLAFDTTADIVNGRVVARRFTGTTATGTVRLVATTATLQSPQRPLAIVPAPDTFAREGGAPAITVRYSLPPSPADSFPTLSVKVGRVVIGGVAGVPSYLVRFRLLRRGQEITALDTTQSFFLTDGGARVTTLDTTGADGVAARQLIYRRRSGQPVADTVEVLADVRRGSRIPAGPPLKWIVAVQPR